MLLSRRADGHGIGSMSSWRTELRSSSAVPVLYDEDGESSASTVTNAVPPLTRSTSTLSYETEAPTDVASDLDGGYVLEVRDGVLTIPERYELDRDLLCPFQILDCEKKFSEVVDFKMHVFSHFRGHALPTLASCFLCDIKFSQTSDDDPARSWNNMLSHMVHNHFRQGQQLATVRTDFTLMRWMYNRRLISVHQFKRTQLCSVPILLSSALRSRSVAYAPSPPFTPSAPVPTSFFTDSIPSVGLQTEPYTVTAGGRAERRRRDATRQVF